MLKKFFNRTKAKLGHSFWRDIFGIIIILVVVALVTEFGIFYNSHPNYYTRISTYFYLFLPSLSLLFFISYNYQKKRGNLVPTAQSIRYRFLMFFLLTALLPSTPLFIISSDIIQRNIDRYALLNIEEIANLPKQSLRLHYRPYYQLAQENLANSLCSSELLETWYECIGIELDKKNILYSSPSAKQYYEFYETYVNTSQNEEIDFFTYNLQTEKAVAVLNLQKRLYFFPLKKEEEKIFKEGVHFYKKYQSLIYFVDPLKKVIDVFLALLLIFVLIITILIAVIISKDITDPIIQLSHALRGVFSGNLANTKRRLERLLKKKSPGEIQVLAEITQKMVLELEEYKNQQYLIQKNLAWQDVARKMAHEIKNPLTPMQLSIERIIRQLKNYHEQIPAEFQKIIVSSSDSILRQIQAIQKLLNALSKMARMPVPHKSEINLANILCDLVNENQSENMDIFLRIEDNDLLIQGDADQLRRAFLNILQNARQAMQRKKVFIQKPTLYVGARWVERKKNIEVFFLDNGQGVAPDHVSKITEANFTTKENGEGLGLAISKKILEDHGAKLMISSHVEDKEKNEEGETTVSAFFTWEP